MCKQYMNREVQLIDFWTRMRHEMLAEIFDSVRVTQCQECGYRLHAGYRIWLWALSTEDQ